MLRRADILPFIAGQREGRGTNRYVGNLLQQDPYIKKKTAAAEAKGLERGLEKGRLEALQGSVVSVVAIRFPRLADVARRMVKHIEKADELTALLQQFSVASDEIAARRILNPPSA
jgi:hypothetical protein